MPICRELGALPVPPSPIVMAGPQTHVPLFLSFFLSLFPSRFLIKSIRYTRMRSGASQKVQPDPASSQHPLVPFVLSSLPCDEHTRGVRYSLTVSLWALSLPAASPRMQNYPHCHFISFVFSFRAFLFELPCRFDGLFVFTSSAVMITRPDHGRWNKDAFGLRGP